MAYEPLKYSATLSLPAHATTIVFSSTTSDLAVGSDDGSVRLYSSPFTKVTKAIRNLGNSVSGIVFTGQLPESQCLWVVAGRNVLKYKTGEELKLILDKNDASHSMTFFGDEEDDTLNDVAINTSQSHIAITGDSGRITLIDLSSELAREMKAKHSSIAWKAAFVPTRRNELVTGGYDCTLLHFDYRLGSVLSSYEISATPSLAPGISSLPPFITAMTISSSGIIATGTADGRIWIGAGGSKSSAPPDKGKSKKTPSRKWNGLDEKESSMTKQAESLISDLLFLTPNQLLSCTVSGKLTLYKLVPATTIEPDLKPGREGSKRQILQETWTTQCTTFEKVDKMALERAQGGTAKQVAICGVGADRKGIVQLWTVFTTSEGETREIIN